MTSAKPYLIRAIYEWIVDNEKTPYVSVDTTFPQVVVPEQYIANDGIILDIAPFSIKDLLVDNEAMSFKAQFNGIVHNIYIPIPAVVSIYASENNQGMTFPKEEPTSQDNGQPLLKKEKPQIKIITGGKD